MKNNAGDEGSFFDGPKDTRKMSMAQNDLNKLTSGQIGSQLATLRVRRDTLK